MEDAKADMKNGAQSSTFLLFLGGENIFVAYLSPLSNRMNQVKQQLDGGERSMHNCTHDISTVTDTKYNFTHN
jgi:hypothetical protein